eukprot:symbB.v1.2.029381.t1/scaffold3206.1/size61198/7
MAIQRGSPLRSRGQRLGGTPLRTARRSSTARRSITPRPSLLAPRQTEPVTLERQAPRPSVPSVNPSFSVEKGAGKHLSRGNPLIDVVNENEKNENEKKNDKWSGIHESLKGLTSFIAKIGSPERLRSSRSPEAPVESVWQGPISFAEEMHHVQQSRCSETRIKKGPLHKMTLAAAGEENESVFAGLKDFKSLTRERSLEALIQALAAGRYNEVEVQQLALETMKSDAWEAKQGGLQAAAEAIKAWDAPDFRARVLEEVPRLLVDPEYRVRKAVSSVLRECCQRDGLVIYDKMGKIVLDDIRDKFKRPEEPKESEQNAGADPKTPWDFLKGWERNFSEGYAEPPAPPVFLHDTEGWRSLETSMGALEAMMQGCGEAFTPYIDESMLDLMQECSRHTNRFVREYTYFALKNVYDVCDHGAFMSLVAPKTVAVLANGIKDNWSQVRYAASVAARAFNDKAGDEKEKFYPQLLGLMCLNRHYVAEGVRLFSQETWRRVCGPQGGARLLVAHFDSVLDAYVDACRAPNHAVREAASNCISELAARVAGSPLAPTPFREHFTSARVQRMLNALLDAFRDESWPVRDVASTALGHFVQAFPDECKGILPEVLELWFDQMADNIPSLRRNGAAALASAMKVWPELWSQVLPRLQKTLPEVLMQPEHSEIFTDLSSWIDYTPSGPFSVPKSKSTAVGEKSDPAFTDQVMYRSVVIRGVFTAESRFKKSGRLPCSERWWPFSWCWNCDWRTQVAVTVPSWKVAIARMG